MTASPEVAGLDIAGGDQPPRRLMQARIVPDHKKRAHRRRRALYQRDNGLGAGIVETLLVGDPRWAGQHSGDAFPRLPCALRGRYQHEFRNERMTCHIGADHRCIGFAAGIEPARAVAHAAFGLFRFGVSQQYQAHCTSVDFPRSAV